MQPQSSPVVATTTMSNNTLSNNTSLSNSCNFVSNFTIWHRRLGHAHSDAVKTILALCNIGYQNKNVSDFCNSCCLAKAHCLHAPPSKTEYHAPFDLVFSDLWGPAPYESTDGFSYYVTFVDAFTRFTWNYFLKSSSDTMMKF